MTAGPGERLRQFVPSRRSAVDHTENALSLRTRALREAGATLIDLTCSNPEQAGLHHKPTLLQALAAQDNLRYRPDPQGLRSAREAIADDLRGLGAGVDPGDILLTSGTSEAYGLLLKLLCDPGDEVLIPEPSYPLLPHLCQLEAVRAVPYPLRYDGRFHIDLPALRAQVTERTRAVVVVNPNSPTGSYLKRDELSAIAALGLPLISDEVFATYPHSPDPDRVQTLLQVPEVSSACLSGLSKCAGLPQLKLSWIALAGSHAFRDTARARLSFMADAYLSVASPVQHAAGTLLEAGRALRPRIQRRTMQNLQALQAAVLGSPVSARHVEGGWYAPVQLPRVLNDEAWALLLLEQARVQVQPGYFYDFAEEGHLVLSLLPEPAVFQEGVARLLQTILRQCAR